MVEKYVPLDIIGDAPQGMVGKYVPLDIIGVAPLSGYGWKRCPQLTSLELSSLDIVGVVLTGHCRSFPYWTYVVWFSTNDKLRSNTLQEHLNDMRRLIKLSVT